jgi:hypothetical protein
VVKKSYGLIASVDAGLAASSEGSYDASERSEMRLMALSTLQTASIVHASSAILVGSLNLAFRFAFRLNAVRRATLIAITVVLLVISDHTHSGWLWSSVWLFCACSGVYWTKYLNPNVLILNAIVLYGLCITSVLDSLGLSSAYNHPFVWLTIISIGWIALLWSGIAELNKAPASERQPLPTSNR